MDSGKMKLSIIMPVYNEEKTVKEILKQVIAVDFSMFELGKEIIVVDDDSTDGTREILKKYQSVKVSERQSKDEIKIIYHEKNKGKGAAIRTGFANATGDILVIQDADLEYNPAEFRDMLKPILMEEVSVVYGSRFLRDNPCIYLRYNLGNRFLSFLVRFLYGGNVTDSYTCYKMMKMEVLKKIVLESNGFEIEVEITSKILKAGYKILEVPISYNPRSLEQGKKIGWSDAVHGIWTIIKNRLTK